MGRLAGALARAGVRRHDVVAWQLPNRAEAVLLFAASWRLGAVAVPLHHLAGATEVERMVARVEPAALFASPGVAVAEHPKAMLVGSERWEELCAGPPLDQARCHPADLAVALFTSGSTGEPKAVLHTHRALAHKAGALAAAHELDRRDTVLMPAPLSHISGLMNGVLVPAVAGADVVLMGRWDPGRALGLIGREGVSFMVGPPTIFVDLARDAGFSPAAVASLRLISLGSTTITPETVSATARTFDAVVKRTYGSTEAPNVTTTRSTDPPGRGRDTDGRAVGGAELRVVAPGTSRALPPGTPGELVLRGPELFVGYAEPEQTRAALLAGWYHTGDIATLDEDGWLTIVGRQRELIIRAGENIVPAEVEAVLERHPLVDQAVVVGYPDERLGEGVAAVVLGDRAFDLQTCRRWFAEQGVARFKTPERLEHLDAFPVLSLGKPDRAALRARLAAR